MTTTDLRRICGISKRRLQWWHDRKFVQARPIGSARKPHHLEWSGPAALAAAIFANLSYRHKRVFGILAPQIRREARRFAARPAPGEYLVIDASHRVRRIPHDEVLPSYSHAPGGLTLIPMSEIWERIAASGGAQ